MGTLKPEKLIPFLGVLLFGLALWVLHRELKTVHYIDVVREIRALPPFRVVLALALAALGYLALTGYDAAGVRYIRHALPYSRTAMVSFISYAVSQNVGGSLVSGGSVRMRLYSQWGFSTVEITKVVAFCALTFWMGFFSVGGGEPPARAASSPFRVSRLPRRIAASGGGLPRRCSRVPYCLCLPSDPSSSEGMGDPPPFPAPCPGPGGPRFA